MISIAAIFKNEQPYILEWLAYHMALGIKDFYIADNGSSDGGSELLHNLDMINVITRIEHPTVDNVPPQLDAYSKIMSLVDKNKWVAFIDADEFIFTNDFESGLDKLLPILNDDANGAISLSWAVFGSSYSILPDNGLVIERFTRRALEEHPVNKHYKSIVRIGDVLSVGKTPHAFQIKPNKRFIMPNGVLQEQVDGVSNYTDWTGIRLNHYVIKSKSEFFNKKSARGRATTMKQSLGRNINFFNNHDLNDVHQSMPSWFLRKVKDILSEIIFKLEVNGFKTTSEYYSECLYRTSNKMGVGVVDTLVKEEGEIKLKGWAVDGDKLPLVDVVAVINNKHLIKPKCTKLYDRPDVKVAGISDEVKCGFISSVTLPDEPISFIHIYAINKSGLACVEFNLSAHSAII